MKLHNLCLVGLLAIGVTACGGKDEQASSTDDVFDAMEKAGNDARDVKIRDKPGMTQTQKLANTYLNEMSKMADVLETVEDQKSAEKAAKIISGVVEEINELSREFDGDGAASSAGMTAVMMSRQQEFMAVQQRMTSQMMRIQMQKPELMQMIQAEMEKMDAQR